MPSLAFHSAGAKNQKALQRGDHQEDEQKS